MLRKCLVVIESFGRFWNSRRALVAASILIPLHVVAADPLIKDVSYSRDVYGIDPLVGKRIDQHTFSGSDIPATGQITAHGPYGGKIDSSYSFTGDDVAASFGVSAYYFASSYEAVAEESYQTPIWFRITRPVSYVLTAVADNIIQTNELNHESCCGVAFGSFTASDGTGKQVQTKDNHLAVTVSGKLPKGATVSYYPGISANPYRLLNGEISAPVEGNGHVTLTLTALPNLPPSLAPIPDQKTQVGFLLELSAIAVDGDSPPDLLTYTLGDGAPAGASIDPKTGAFSWKIAKGQGPAIYPITITVTDDGVPPASVSQSFTISVCAKNEAGVLVCDPPETQQPEKGDGKACCRYGEKTTGEPITIATGNLFETMVDYQAARGVSLSFARYYNSHAAADLDVPMLGQHWRSTFDRYLRTGLQINGQSAIKAERADGRVLTFILTGGAWASDSDIIVVLKQDGARWLLTDSDDSVETYEPTSQGAVRLAAIRSRAGYTQRLLYAGDGTLDRVIDSFGRSLRFHFENSLLKTLTASDGLIVTYGYNSSGASGILDRLADVTYSTVPATSAHLHYERADHPFALAGVTDENGDRYVTWTYDDQGRANSSQFGNGHDLVSIGDATNAHGTRIVTNSLQLITQHGFKGVEGVPKQTGETRSATDTTDAGSMAQDYDGYGYVRTRTDWNGNTTTYQNDPRGQPTHTQEAVGTPVERGTGVTYQPTFHLPSHVDLPLHTIDFTPDERGNTLARTETDLSTQTEPYSTKGQSRTWGFSYNAVGQVLSATGPRTDLTATTTFGYETNGNVLAVTNALKQIVRFTRYNERGQPLEMVDVNGVTNVFGYHPRGWLQHREVLSTNGNAATDYAFDAAGQLKSLTLPDHSQLRYTYDSSHRLRAVTNSLGESILYTPDEAGNITREETRDPDGNITKLQRQEFDALSRLRKLIGASDQTTQFGYDGNGNRVTITDGFQRTATNRFDALDRMQAVLDPLNQATQQGFDAQDSLASVTDPRQLKTGFINDGFGRRILETSPDRGTLVYRLDEMGNRVEETDARKVVTKRVFDALDRVTSESFPSSPSENISYSYDSTEGGNKGVGRLTGFTDETGSTALGYDERGNLLSNQHTIGGKAYSTGYRYDVADHLTQVTYPSGRIVTYGRDSLGRINSVDVRESQGGPSKPLASQVTYKPFGPISGFVYGNGLRRVHGFDQDYRLRFIETGTGNASVQSLGLEFDAVNNITAITNRLDDNRSQRFGYDENSRLTNAVGSYGTLAYQYDGVGNRTLEVENGHTNSYAYSPTANRLDGISGGEVRVFTYTDAGNTATDDRGTVGTYGYQYGARNRLNTLTLNGQTVATYGYNAFGQRCVKTVGTTVTHFHYDPQSHLVAESDGQTGAILREYVWLGDMPLAVMEADGSVNFIHCDHLNTPQKMTDASGAVVWDREQKPFGETTAILTRAAPKLTASGLDGQGHFQGMVNGAVGAEYIVQRSSDLNGGGWVSVVTNAAPFTFTDAANANASTRFYRVMATVSRIENEVMFSLRFPGQYFDAESGLNNNIMRDYNPLLGRYIEVDPIGLAGGLNVWTYSMNMPTRFVDSDGMLIVGAVIGGIYGGISGGIGAAVIPGATRSQIIFGIISGGALGAGIGLLDPSDGAITIGRMALIGGIGSSAGDALSQVMLSDEPFNYCENLGAGLGGAAGAGGAGIIARATEAALGEALANIIGNTIALPVTVGGGYGGYEAGKEAPHFGTPVLPPIIILAPRKK